MKVLPKNELQRRRRAVMRMMEENSIAIIAAAPEKIRNRDVEYPYRQDSDFLYLTNFNEPEAVAVLIPDREQGEFIMFCRDRDPKLETWHGRREGPEGVVEHYHADDAFPISDIDEILPGLLEQRSRVYYTMGKDTQFDTQLLDWIKQLRKAVRSGANVPHEFVDLEYLTHELRLFKSRSELRLMREAAKITHDAHVRAMSACEPGVHEFEIEAELLHAFRRANTQPAYPSIVGGGVNGCILHYTDNADELKDGDLLLIDAGCEYQGYASDVTRTFPVNGQFNEGQRELYNLVLEAQKAAIEQTLPGNHWNEPHEAAVKVLTKGLVELGLLKGSVDKLIEDHSYRRFYMHRTGHWLGLDVHDVGDYKFDDEWRILEPGMVLTIEPGLYIPDNSRGIRKKWWNIGIRIEDDVLVTADGNEVLTASIPKTIDDIEALMSA